MLFGKVLYFWLIILNLIFIEGIYAEKLKKIKPKLRNIWNDGNCKDVRSFKFDNEPPTWNTELSYCQQYRGETCCNRTHTDRIIKIIYPYHEPNMTDKCRVYGVSIECSWCNPKIGTHKLNGICLNTCNEWYNACKDDYFKFDRRNKLVPCSLNDQYICTKLDTFISNGTEMCQKSGFDINEVILTCFDGKHYNLKQIPRHYDTSIWEELNLFFNDFMAMFIQLPRWKQFLLLSGMSATFYYITKVLLTIICSCFISNNKSNINDINHENHSIYSNNILTEQDQQLIRERRLKKLKVEQLLKSQNMERDLAQKLGMTFNMNNDNQTSNENESNNINKMDRMDIDDDIST